MKKKNSPDKHKMEDLVTMSKPIKVDYDSQFDLCQEQEDEWVSDILGGVKCYVDEDEVNCKTWKPDY